MYVPNNLAMFTAAFAGALAGMGASDRYPSETNPLDYAGLTNVAGAFAQSFDTQWAATPSSTLTVETAQQLCEVVWQEKQPLDVAPFNLPSNYTGLTNALVAMINASTAYYAAEGIPTDVIPDDTGNGLIVATIADLSLADTTSLETDATAKVASLKGTEWRLDKASAATVDGITCVAANGGGRWFRNQTTVTAYLAYDKWYFDNINGNDENAGNLDISPIKTFAEFNRRIGSGNLLPGAVSNALGSPLNLVTLNLLSNMPASDKFEVNAKILNNALFAVVGNALPTATGGTNTGTFTAVTAQNRATNTQWSVTDATITWANHIGKSLVVTAGPNIGMVATIEADLGAGVAAVSTPNNPFTPANALTPNPLEPPDRLAEVTLMPGIFSIGDAFTIVDLTTMYVGAQTIDSGMQAQNLPLNGPSKIGFSKIHILYDGTPPFPPSAFPIIATGSSEPLYKHCRFQKLLISNTYQRSFYINCSAEDSVNVVSATAFWNGGVIRGLLSVRNGSLFVGDYDAAVRGSALVLGGTLAAALMRVSNGPFNGITVGSVSTIVGNIAQLTSQIVRAGVTGIWGAGHLAYGIYLLPGSSGKYQTLANMTITGGGGNFILGNGPGALASSFDPATGLVSPQTIPSTWANMAIAAPAGFGGHAHNFAANCHLVNTI